MSNPGLVPTEQMARMSLGFNRKAYIKKYQQRKATCVHCGTRLLAYKMRRHWTSRKCLVARLVNDYMPVYQKLVKT